MPEDDKNNEKFGLEQMVLSLGTLIENNIKQDNILTAAVITKMLPQGMAKPFYGELAVALYQKGENSKLNGKARNLLDTVAEFYGNKITSPEESYERDFGSSLAVTAEDDKKFMRLSSDLNIIEQCIEQDKLVSAAVLVESLHNRLKGPIYGALAVALYQKAGTPELNEKAKNLLEELAGSYENSMKVHENIFKETPFGVGLDWTVEDDKMFNYVASKVNDIDNHITQGNYGVAALLTEFLPDIEYKRPVYAALAVALSNEMKKGDLSLESQNVINKVINLYKEKSEFFEQKTNSNMK